MLTEKDIALELGDYWVRKVEYGFDVYKTGVTHSTKVAIIGYKGEEGLRRARAEIERRIAAEGL